jgi:hypothetical protein
MSIEKNAASEAAWAILTQGVTSSRIEAHKLKNYFQRVQTLVDSSEKKDHLYQVAGDLLKAFPEVLERLSNQLDKTSYALSMMGQDFLAQQLPFEDKNEVLNAVAVTKPFGGSIPKNSSIVTKFLMRNKNDK